MSFITKVVNCKLVNAALITDVLPFADWFYGEFTQSQLYATMMELQKVIDQLYRDITQRDVVTNVFDYTKKLARFLGEKFGLGESLLNWGSSYGVMHLRRLLIYFGSVITL